MVGKLMLLMVNAPKLFTTYYFSKASSDQRLLISDPKRPKMILDPTSRNYKAIIYPSVIRYRPSYVFEPQLWFAFTARLCKLHRLQKPRSLLTVCIFIRLNHAENKVSWCWLCSNIYKMIDFWYKSLHIIMPTFNWYQYKPQGKLTG